MPPRDGARPCASRSASHSSSELDADSVARGASEAGAEGAEGPETSAEGCDPVEAACRARETRERRSWGGGTGGQLLVAKPVTSPDSARATEPRRWSCDAVHVEHVWAAAQESESECESEERRP